MRTPIRLLVVASAAALSHAAEAQVGTSPADGPWSGQVQCVLTTRGANYLDEQTHTWRITGGPPVLNGMFRQWPAVWSVRGSGNRRVGSPATKGGGGGQTESWTIDVPERSAPIAIAEAPGGHIRFGSQHGLLVANGAVTGRTVTPGNERPFTATLQEWEFPIIDDLASKTTISGTRTRTLAKRGNGWRQPEDVTTVETCTWSFTKGNVAPVLPGSVARGDVPSPNTPPPAPTDAAAPNPPVPASLSTAKGDPVGVTEDLTVPVPCQMPGPVIQSPVTVTPARAYLQWTAVPGATGYTVARNDIGLITAAPIQATTFVHYAPFDYRVAYTYTVTALYKVGCGSSRVTLTPPRPGTPAILAVNSTNGNVATRKGGVRISWRLPGSDATGYLVLGPGLPPDGREIPAPVILSTYVGTGRADSAFGTKTPGAPGASAVPPTTQIEISDVPAGTHTWRITPFWNTPTGRVIDVSTGAQATAKVGFYRVSITGVRVDHETVDNPFSVDGRGDEIYVAAAAYLAGELVAIGKSSVYGDDNPAPILGNFLGIFVPPTGFRIRAGSGSVTGGLRTGDVIPSSNQILPNNPPLATMFPFVVWEGWLGGSSEVVVKPTIWEWDGDLTNYNTWSALMRGWRPNPDEIAVDRLTQSAVMIGSLNPTLRQLTYEQQRQDQEWRADLEKARARQLASRDSMITRPGYDRAIGGLNKNWFSVHADGLTLISDSEVLADGRPAPPPAPTATATLHFVDDADLGGQYSMFIKFQQLP